MDLCIEEKDRGGASGVNRRLSLRFETSLIPDVRAR